MASFFDMMVAVQNAEPSGSFVTLLIFRCHVALRHISVETLCIVLLDIRRTVELAPCHVEVATIPTSSFYFGETFFVWVFVAKVICFFQYFFGNYFFHGFLSLIPVDNVGALDV